MYASRPSYEEIPLLTADNIVIPLVGLRKALSMSEFVNNVPTIAGSNRDEVKLWLASAEYFVDLDFSVIGSILNIPKVKLNDNEKVSNLIEDPWRVHLCSNGEVCEFTFSDNDFDQTKRDAVYYVKAIEENSKIINADNLRCEFDEFGNCKSVNICSGSALITPYEDDCLAEDQERAWSSPIFVDYKKY